MSFLYEIDFIYAVEKSLRGSKKTTVSGEMEIVVPTKVDVC